MSELSIDEVYCAYFNCVSDGDSYGFEIWVDSSGGGIWKKQTHMNTSLPKVASGILRNATEKTKVILQHNGGCVGEWHSS